MKPEGLDEARAAHEVAHGRRIAQGDTEALWGWGTPAGKRRAIRRARLIADGAGLRPGTRALEIGCGTGLFTEMFAQSGAQLVAVDISGDLLEKARLRRLPPEQVTFLKKRFEDCDVDGPFDAVIGSSVLHHLEIGPALRRIYQLLRPGGVMSFAEPNMRNPQVFAERRFRFLFPRVSPDETAFVRGRLAKLLAGTGFEDVEVVPHGWLHPAVPAFCVGPTERIEAALEAIPLIREFSGSLYIRARRPMSNRTARRCPRAHDERVSSR